MKKILILASDFPPYHSIGAQRPHSWYRYFGAMGIEPTVVTRHWADLRSSDEKNRTSSRETEFSKTDLGKIVCVPYRENLRDRLIARFGMRRFVWLRKILSLFFDLAQYFSFRFDSLSEIYRASAEVLRSNSYDAIIATGEPFVLFRHAAKLSDRFAVPWVADYRDGWSTIAHISYYGFVRRFLFLQVFSRIEKRLLKNAALITTASPNYASALARLHPTKKTAVIYNGFDEDFAVSADVRKTETDFFKITYAGTLYPYQPAELFLAGLEKFCRHRPEALLKVFFHGMNFNAPQKNRVKKNIGTKSEGKVVFTDKLPKQKLYEAAQSSHLFLLFGDESVPALAGKLFDYLLMKRQILFVKPDSGPQEEILKTCKTGIFCADDEAVFRAIDGEYRKWEKGISAFHCPENYGQFSRKKQASLLVGLLQGLEKGSGSR